MFNVKCFGERKGYACFRQCKVEGKGYFPDKSREIVLDRSRTPGQDNMWEAGRSSALLRGAELNALRGSCLRDLFRISTDWLGSALAMLCKSDYAR